jgi:hypothetical protein
MSIFGQRIFSGGRRRPTALEQPMLPVDDIALETPDPLTTVRPGQFGAGQQKRNDMAWFGSGLKDIGTSLRGGSSNHLDDFYAGEQASQEAADWQAQLDGMDLAPEVRTFAEANPDAFKMQQFADFQTKQADDASLDLLAGLNLPEDVMKRARMNPKGFMEELGKGAGKTQTETYQDPITGEWKIRPYVGQNGDFAVYMDGAEPTFTQRPKTHEEIETERAAREEAGLERQRLAISGRNARTAELNASRPSPAPRGRGGAIIDDPNQPPIPGEDIRFTPNQNGGGFIEGMNGGRLIRVGIGADGKYAPTDGDPVIPSGKRFPPPSFSTVEGLGDKAGPNINAENKIMQGITTARDSAVHIKNLTDKYITFSEGYPFGVMPHDVARQWINPKTEGLRGLNATMALEVGKMAKGAMSDADREWFMKAAPNEKGQPESNAVFAMRANAVANRANQYATFMQQYRSDYGNGSLAEAQRYWDMYSLANPVFDDNGDAVEKPMGYQEFFTGTPAKRQDVFERDYPGARGNSGGGLSAAEQKELEQLQRELGTQ